MSTEPLLRISREALNSLMASLEISVVALSECVVCSGYRMQLGGFGAPGIHYNLKGHGRLHIGKEPPIELTPHTLVIVPPNTPFHIEAVNSKHPLSEPVQIDGRQQTNQPGEVRRFVAGSTDPEIILICGYFKASYGAAIDLFGPLTSPIVERFTAEDHVDHKLKDALAELVSQEIGTGAMATALLKQVLVALLRRSLNSLNLWVERFSILSDPQISRAFSDMVARPGAAHTIESLASTACVSRSAFMARFTEIFGQPPMNVLRELRMRQAVQQLGVKRISIESIARSAGYASTSSFIRAFKKAHGVDPSEYRARLETAPTEMAAV